MALRVSLALATMAIAGCGGRTSLDSAAPRGSDAGLATSRGSKGSTRTMIVNSAKAPSALVTRSTTGLCKIDASIAVMTNPRVALAKPPSVLVPRFTLIFRLG